MKITKSKKIVVAVIVVITIIILSISFTVGIVWAICKLMGWAFSWKIALAIWLALTLVETSIGGRRHE